MENTTYSLKELLRTVKNNASDIQITVGVPPVLKVRRISICRRKNTKPGRYQKACW